MNDFDQEVEKVVERSGRTAGWLGTLAFVSAVSGVGFGFATVDQGGLGVVVTGLFGGGVLYGIGTIINLQGMQLLETWKQGKRTEVREE